MAPVSGMASPRPYGESLQIQISSYVPLLCVLHMYIYRVKQMLTEHPDWDTNCTATDCRALGKWLKHSSKHSNGTPNLARDYQLPAINPCTPKRPSNVQIGQINTF